MEKTVFPAQWDGLCPQCHGRYVEGDPICYSHTWLDHIHARCWDSGPDGTGEHIGTGSFVPPLEFRAAECA